TLSREERGAAAVPCSRAGQTSPKCPRARPPPALPGFAGPRAPLTAPDLLPLGSRFGPSPGAPWGRPGGWGRSSKRGRLVCGAACAPARCLAGPAQKLVFNRVNGKRPQVLPQQVSAPEECYTLAHEENVRFVYEAWQQVEQQLDGSRSGESACGPVQYVEKTPNPELMKNFVPIDLEEWWAQQFLAKIENCT
uniref:MAPK regulated corepressor interacting protein 2 n=1 Tax=Falco tinnunculus TaxID=100819 RepID=A0A8C4V859_FALTI